MAEPWKNSSVRNRIWRERGRTQCRPTLKLVWEEIKTKSRVGVEYTHYKPTYVKA